ncbi:heterokaryon incompatibility protein-domain-containing protein, partial [Bisporella sp. PMI_857]
MATFTYSALDLAGPTFRLIRLLPGLSFDMIECEMIEARLEGLGDTIPYEALSYTWGQDGKNKCIEVNGCSFPVTANLHLALLHLRHRSSDRLLWVDAICINQSDPTERGHQVKQMRYIYQEAEQVLIWLGSATNDTDIAMSTMMDLQQISLRGNSNWRQLADILLDTDLTHPRISLKIRRRFGAQELISRPWFNRVWILQEVANSRAALILCGHQSVLARIFALAMPLLLENTIDSHCQAVLDIMPGISRRESWWSRERSLRTLLLKFNMSIATDPRDMVFALLGMSSDIPDDSLVQVNYHKTLGEVIRDTVIFLL